MYLINKKVQLFRTPADLCAKKKNPKNLDICQMKTLQKVLFPLSK